jgi:hypothetical protein
MAIQLKDTEALCQDLIKCLDAIVINGRKELPSEVVIAFQYWFMTYYREAKRRSNQYGTEVFFNTKAGISAVEDIWFVINSFCQGKMEDIEIKKCAADTLARVKESFENWKTGKFEAA